MVKVKFYTDKEFLPENQRYIPLLYPFWGAIEEGQDSFLDIGRFDEYSRIGQSLFSLVSPEKADVFLLPGEWRSWDENYHAKTLASLAKRHNKSLIIFFNSDSTENITLEGAIIFRTSLYASRRKHNEFAMPCWSRDFLKAYFNGQLHLRDKPQCPKVGYTGYVDYGNITSYLKHFLLQICRFGKNEHPGASIRGKAVRFLRKHPSIDSDFILRSSMCTDSEIHRLEYARNIYESDYTIAARGGGNFSYRLYEIMSCGRIPLFINTDCVLPFDHLLQWRDTVVWVEDKEISTIVEHLLSFNDSITNESFKTMQQQARKIYEEWLSPTGFYSNLWQCIPGLGCNAK